MDPQTFHINKAVADYVQDKYPHLLVPIPLSQSPGTVQSVPKALNTHEYPRLIMCIFSSKSSSGSATSSDSSNENKASAHLARGTTDDSDDKH